MFKSKEGQNLVFMPDSKIITNDLMDTKPSLVLPRFVVEVIPFISHLKAKI